MPPHEHDVLLGLAAPLPALSFEFTTIQRDIARHCLARLESLARHRYNLSLGEQHRLEFESWLTAQEMERHLLALPHETNSGDVYAMLQS